MPAEIEIGIKVWLHPLDLVREVIADRDITAKPGDYDKPSHLDNLEESIKQIRYVREAEFGHLNYVEVDPETDNFDTARQRIAKVKERVGAKIRIWAKKLPPKKS